MFQFRNGNEMAINWVSCVRICASLPARARSRAAQTSLRQMNQTRLYVVERRNGVVQVSLMLGGFPCSSAGRSMQTCFRSTWQSRVSLCLSRVSLTSPAFQLVNSIVILPRVGLCTIHLWVKTLGQSRLLSTEVHAPILFRVILTDCFSCFTPLSFSLSLSLIL